MWLELICGLLLYKLVKRFLCDGDDLALDIPSSSSTDADALFSAADKLQNLYRGAKIFVGLQIPDPDSASRQNIDLVLLLDGEAVVISVKNDISGIVSVEKDGTWVCSSLHKNHTKHIPNPVVEAQKKISILESYLQQRGLDLPREYFSFKIICPNLIFRPIHPSSFPSEVVTYEQWVQLKPDTKSILSGWIKGVFRYGKKEIQESLSEKLNFLLSTAPMWDRLELKGNKYIIGDFREFRGKQDDVQALQNIRRSKVSRLIIQKTSMFGLAPSKLQILYCPRDYRGDGATASEWKEVTVKSSTEVLFQARYSSKVCKFKLSSVISMTLSA